MFIGQFALLWVTQLCQQFSVLIFTLYYFPLLQILNQYARHLRIHEFMENWVMKRSEAYNLKALFRVLHNHDGQYH